MLGVLLAVGDSSAAPAELSPRAEQLKSCLGDFGGIAWQYPYAPTLHTYRCTSPAASYNASTSTDGIRRLELISGGGLEQLTPDNVRRDDYAETHEAVYRHFDTLLSRQGFTREPPRDAETPFERHARYTRFFGGRLETLTFESDAGNVWTIRLEGLPGAPPAERSP